MDDRELQAWVESVSLKSFGIPFRHRATFNGRLSTTGGRYFLKSHNIEISPKQLAVHGAEETEKIIKHELCHYHLHLAGRGYRHQDADFKQLLKKVGATLHCKSLPGARRSLPVKYLLVCKECGMTYPRKRKVDPRRYACGRCRGKLKLLAAPPQENGVREKV
ncbi:SprT family protein [Cohnella thailandensis]|uniref:SprT family protein n=1 Tax=Cohnella thailandensis TaxID=557557 RepID=A0A841SQN1_9BACL|nr:SprT family protein [Cohnella thailandensis]MBB6633502.1 SprT family protein [Cohnella thailandensis]MBP1974519.1 SprT-like protein [Cohnella thailandensis]